MGERVIKTGLSKKYKDMLDAVIGQMSDGYWENSPMMRGYWKFVNIGTSGDEATLNVAETSGALDGDRRVENRFYGMPDDAVKKFFADKIKFLIKEEGLGKWDRDNERKTDYLSHGEARYRVKDCYYAYEILKGRNARKHPEYDDVAESKHPVKIKLIKKNESYESDLEDIAQSSGEIDYGDAMALDRAAAGDGEIRKKVRDLIMDWRSAAEDGDDDEMTKAAKALKALADLKAIGLSESNSNEAFDGWDGWEDIEGLENALDGIENLTYELRSCVRGAKTGCKDWKALALYIKGLAANLDDAAEEMAYRRDDEDESKKKKKNPSKNFSSTVEEDEDGNKLSH